MPIPIIIPSTTVLGDEGLTLQGQVLSSAPFEPLGSILQQTGLSAHLQLQLPSLWTITSRLVYIPNGRDTQLHHHH